MVVLQKSELSEVCEASNVFFLPKLNAINTGMGMVQLTSAC